MFNSNEVLINIIYPNNKVTYIKPNPTNDKLFVGIDEFGYYSEDWEVRKYMPITEYEEVE